MKLNKEDRKNLEQRLFDLTYDMSFIYQKDELWESIRSLTDREVVDFLKEAIEEVLEGEEKKQALAEIA